MEFLVIHHGWRWNQKQGGWSNDIRKTFTKYSVFENYMKKQQEAHPQGEIGYYIYEPANNSLGRGKPLAIIEYCSGQYGYRMATPEWVKFMNTKDGEFIAYKHMPKIYTDVNLKGHIFYKVVEPNDSYIDILAIFKYINEKDDYYFWALQIPDSKGWTRDYTVTRFMSEMDSYSEEGYSSRGSWKDIMAELKDYPFDKKTLIF